MSDVAHPSLGDWLEYYLGEAPAAAADALDEHLFECAACEAQLDALRRTASAMVALMRRGAIAASATSAIANRMARDRLNVRSYLLMPGETVACTVGQDDDFLMGRFVLPPGTYTRVDLRVLNDAGQELMRTADIAIDARSRHAIMFMPARPITSEGSAVWHYVLSTPGPDGDRELARYSLDHTAFREP
jgi:hypothetical protein